MTHGIDEAILELKRSPRKPVVAEVDGLVIELRCKGRRTADDIFEEVGPWDGELEPEVPAETAPAGLRALSQELATDRRPFKELSTEERRRRIRRVMGSGRGLMSTSEEFARRKREEIALEELSST